MVDSDQKVWLPNLAFAILRVLECGGILTREDVQNLRLTCKELKQLCDPFLKKLKLDVETMYKTLPGADYAPLASCPLLQFLTDVEIRLGHDDFSIHEDIWRSHCEKVYSIVSQRSEQLQRLEINNAERDHRDWNFISRFATCRFPKLKSLSLVHLRPNLPTVEHAFFSMTALEQLYLPKDPPSSYPAGFLEVNDLEVLARAPFLDNLTDLRLSLSKFSDIMLEETVMDSPEFVEPLSSIFRRATNLRKIGLFGSPTLPLWGQAPQLEEVSIDMCICPGSIVLPPSLVRLVLRELDLKSLGGFLNLFTSGNLPLLRHFEAFSYTENDVNDQDINWTEFIHQLKLPSLETLILNGFFNISASDIFSIVTAMPNVPNLKKYEIAVYNRDPVDARLVREFFSSSLAAKLEELDLSNFNLGSGEGLAAMLENISIMRGVKKRSSWKV
jgi:hypothetical protein